MSPNGRGIARTPILSTLADATYASLPQGTRAMVPAHVPASAFWVLGYTNQGQSAGVAGVHGSLFLTLVQCCNA